MLAGESIWFHIMGAWIISKAEIESTEKQGPTSLARVQSLCHLDLNKILMVSPDYEWLFCPLQPVLPFLKSKFNTISSLFPTS